MLREDQFGLPWKYSAHGETIGADALSIRFEPNCRRYFRVMNQYVATGEELKQERDKQSH